MNLPGPNQMSEQIGKLVDACALQNRIGELEGALRELIAVATVNTGGLSGADPELCSHHVEIINRAQRLLGGRELL